MAKTLEQYVDAAIAARERIAQEKDLLREIASDVQWSGKMGRQEFVDFIEDIYRGNDLEKQMEKLLVRMANKQQYDSMKKKGSQ